MSTDDSGKGPRNPGNNGSGLTHATTLHSTGSQRDQLVEVQQVLGASSYLRQAPRTSDMLVSPSTNRRSGTIKDHSSSNFGEQEPITAAGGGLLKMILEEMCRV
mmetsp:Transcript_4129/g.8860  ORF Transcript_4129/g.8860 Transcript_4129/m.8860 type:complete len:104 (+) Transcript_4129:59-370(+)